MEEKGSLFFFLPWYQETKGKELLFFPKRKIRFEKLLRGEKKVQLDTPRAKPVRVTFSMTQTHCTASKVFILVDQVTVCV